MKLYEVTYILILGAVLTFGACRPAPSSPGVYEEPVPEVEAERFQFDRFQLERGKWFNRFKGRDWFNRFNRFKGRA